jgi:hypothetical protein
MNTTIKTNPHHTMRSTAMNTMYEDLARAHMTQRLDEARTRRQGHHAVVLRRLSRRAERAALQARLVLARSI